MRMIATIIVAALFAMAVACGGSTVTKTTVKGVIHPPVTHSHQYLER